MPRSRSLTNISLATRLSLVALVVTLVSLAITAADSTVVDEAGCRWSVHPLDGVDDVYVVEAAVVEAEIGVETRAET